MIDLHTHTNRSDGSDSPAQLVEQAVRAGIEALAITDHDTFAGYEEALEPAHNAGLELICGIELSTLLHGTSVHLLGYFFSTDKLSDFRVWIVEQRASRRERNLQLAERLRELGVDCRLEEAEACGHGMTGRPHFAQVMVEKKYVATLQQAFDEYLGEGAKAYVPRADAKLEDAIARIREAGGVASLAHPVRLKGNLGRTLSEGRALGLNAIETYHSDHTLENTQMYLELAEKYQLLVTGGSDFHGTVKAGVELGTGRNRSLAIPADLVKRLKESLGNRPCFELSS
jgi:3',5'-nucleoside bisphosphate phosphatase